MPRRSWVGLGLAVAVAAMLAAWFLTPLEAPKREAPRPSGVAPLRRGAEPAVASGRETGRVVRTGDRSPVAGAEVLVFPSEPDQPYPRCAICRRGLRWCNDPDSIRTTLMSLREGALARPRPLASTVTEADGTFLLPPQPPGVELVVRAADGFALPGEDPRADIELEVQPAPPVRVLDEHGAPLGGIEVLVYTDVDGHHRTVTSDAAGRLALVPTDLGAWLGTDAPGYVPAALFLLTGKDEALTLSRPKALLIKTVKNGQPHDADVAVVQRGHERKHRARGGEARVEGLSHELTELRAWTSELNSEPQSLPLSAPTTEVVLSLESSAVLVLTLEGDRTGPAGLVTLRPLELGQPGVTRLARPGSTMTLGPFGAGAFQLDVSVLGAASLHRSLELRPGRTELTLSLAGGLEVRGVVVDDLGRALDGVMVRVAGAQSRSVFTNPSGEFALGLEKPGRVTLEASSPTRALATLEAEAPAANLRLVMPREGQLVLEVRKADRRPVSGSVVFVKAEQLKAQLSFLNQLVAGPLALAPGHYRLEARFDGLPEHQLEFDLAVAEQRRLVLELGGGVELAGRVVARSGRGVPRAVVVAICGETSIAEAQTDAEGHFTLGGLPAGPCTLTVTSPHSSAMEDFEVKAPARDVVLTLEAPGRVVRGRALDELGKPLDGLRCDGRDVPTVDGRFALFTGAQRLEFTVRRYLPALVSVTSDDLGDVTLRAIAGCTGVVVSTDGKPVSGVELSRAWVVLGRAVPVGQSGSDGTFSIDLEDAQPSELSAHAAGRSGAARCSPGARVRIVLASEVQVDGVVFEAPGRGGSAQIYATSISATQPRRVVADASGRFKLSLPEGLWVISSSPGGVERTWEVLRPSLTLGLGSAPDTCALKVRAAAPFSTLWLMPPQATTPDAFATTAGAARVQLGHATRSTTVSGLPCGALQLMTATSRQPVVLAPPLTEVELAPP